MLADLLRPWLGGPIEHIGSTAVDGLCAKPVIDIMVGVRSLADSEPAKGALRAVGYHYVAYMTDVMHWFCRPSLAHRTHHLHLIPFEGALWQERLSFRDLLRSDAEVAEWYAALKLSLAPVFEFDREAYTNAKCPFIVQAVEQSRTRAA